MNSVKGIVEELEKVRIAYDDLLVKLKESQKAGTNPEATPELIAKVEQWRNDVNKQLSLFGRANDASRP